MTVNMFGRAAKPKLPPGVGPTRRKLPIGMRLWTHVVLANCLGIAVATLIARLIRAVPETEGMEQGLRFAYYAAMLGVGFVEALLLDEIVFGGAFRLTHLEGRSAKQTRPDEDVSRVAAMMQKSNVSFPFLVLAGSGLTYLLFNAVNHDFDAYYRRVGRHVSALRGDDEAGRERRLMAIAALSIRREPEVLPRLVQLLPRERDVAAWAAWALGRHYDLPRRSLLVEPLVRALHSEDAVVSREALVALGRIQHRTEPVVVETAKQVLAELDRGGELDLRLVYTLGVLQHPKSLSALEAVLSRGPESAQRLAAWALAQQADQVASRTEAVRILEERLVTASLQVRCAIVAALGITSQETSNLALVAAFEASGSTDRVELCMPTQVYLRPDRADDAFEAFPKVETYALRILTTMGRMRPTAANIREKVEPFLERLILDTEASGESRTGAEILLKGIREGRDESTKKSVEEALHPSQP